MSGSPCPVMGSVGDAAREGWWQLDKARFKKLYGSNYELKTKKQVKVDEEVITQPYNPDTN